jgi:hypothetical protein
MRRTLLLCTLLVIVTMTPFASPVQAAEGDEVLVCCDASPVELYLLGSDSNKKLTPFASELGEDPQSVTLETSISSQETIGRWVLPDTWGGAIPASTWTFRMNYEVSNAAGVQINATTTVNIGSKSFSAQTSPGSFLAQGSGALAFDIEIDAMTTSGSSNIELELTAQAVVFSVPGADAKLEFLWGGEDEASSLEATIPVMDIMMLEPEIEGSDVYLAVRLDSPWGLSTLALSESIALRVNGQLVTGDPIETASNGKIRVTWTWTEAAGGEETIAVEVELVFQQGQAALKGSTTYDIETFDSGGGTGTYYPPDEPLRTNGDGSGLNLDIDITLRKDGNGLLLERVTIMTIDDELAFWMRWGMDHIGDDDPALSSTLRAFSSGAVTDEDRISRAVEEVELAEFERQLVTLGPMYMNTGLGLDTEELLGDFRSFNEVKVEVDLNGKNAVINHPVTLRFSTTQLISDGERFDLLRNFIVVQPAPLWGEVSIDLSARSSPLTALSSSILRESDALDLTVNRFPWGDRISLTGEGIDQNEKFTLATLPTSSVAYAPLSLTALTVLGLIGAFVVGLRLTREKRRTTFFVEVLLFPVVLLVLFLGYPPLFIFSALGVVTLIWWVTGMASPRLVGHAQRRVSSYPTLPCPACATLNAVTTTERPHRFNCEGCQRIIKLVA